MPQLILGPQPLSNVCLFSPNLLEIECPLIDISNDKPSILHIDNQQSRELTVIALLVATLGVLLAI
jgi:hypothetical protein